MCKLPVVKFIKIAGYLRKTEYAKYDDISIYVFYIEMLKISVRLFSRLMRQYG